MNWQRHHNEKTRLYRERKFFAGPSFPYTKTTNEKESPRKAEIRRRVLYKGIWLLPL